MSKGLLYLSALCLALVGCKQKMADVAKGIAPGTALSDVESRFGKADEIIDAKGKDGAKSTNKLHIYKALDEADELWVSVDGDKVVWATTHSKDSKLLKDKPGG